MLGYKQCFIKRIRLLKKNRRKERLIATLKFTGDIDGRYVTPAFYASVDSLPGEAKIVDGL
jgi:hypothetical protein